MFQLLLNLLCDFLILAVYNHYKDIDILYFGEEIISLPGLKIPHERIPIRKFVLIPLFELNPGFWDPKTEKTIAEMLKNCEDVLTVHVYEKNQ